MALSPTGFFSLAGFFFRSLPSFLPTFFLSVNGVLLGMGKRVAHPQNEVNPCCRPTILIETGVESD